MEQTQADSSPAEVDVFQGQQPTFAEFSHYRQTGELPERFKPAEEANTDAPEQTVEAPEGDEPETEPDSEPDKEEQEPPQKGSGAEKRIKQLLAEKKELQRRLEEAAKPGAKPDSPSAQAEPAPQYSATAKPTIDDRNTDGTPKFATFEEFNEALIDWKAEEKIAKYKAEQAQQQAMHALKVKLDEARSRYEDADDTIFPAAQTIRDAQIPQIVKEVFAQSENFVDLCYVIGSDPDELKKFISLAQSNPRAAIGKVFEYEGAVKAELAKAKEPESGKAPESKRTQAPKPPTPVSGASSRAFDVSDESLSADEWARKRNQQLRRQGKA